MILLSQKTVAVWMHFEVTLIAVENIFVLTCESEITLEACEGGHVILVDTVFLGHDV